MIEYFCKFFRQIEEHPEKIINDLTIRDYLLARNHVASCEDCQATSDRILAKAPPDNDNRIGFNVN